MREGEEVNAVPALTRGLRFETSPGSAIYRIAVSERRWVAKGEKHLHHLAIRAFWLGCEVPYQLPAAIDEDAGKTLPNMLLPELWFIDT